MKDVPLVIEGSEERSHLQQQSQHQHRYQRNTIKIPNHQSQEVEQQPVKCSMFTQTETTSTFAQTDQSNSSYADQRQVKKTSYNLIKL